MINPTITIAYLPWFAVLLVAFGVIVVVNRARYDTLFGDGGHLPLQRWVRVHGNFCEYVPLALMTIAAAEATGASGATATHWLAGILLLARIFHAVALPMSTQSKLHLVLRVVGTSSTWLVIVVAAGLLLLN